jgi:hypothetical protein
MTIAPREKPLYVPMKPDLKEGLKKLAEENHMSLASYVRMVLHNHVKENVKH